MNGSSRGLVRLDIAPPVRARVLGVPVGLRHLWMSLEEPDLFLQTLDEADRPGFSGAGA